MGLRHKYSNKGYRATLKYKIKISGVADNAVQQWINICAIRVILCGLHLSNGRMQSKEPGASWKLVGIWQEAKDTTCNRKFWLVPPHWVVKCCHRLPCSVGSPTLEITLFIVDIRQDTVLDDPQRSLPN